MRGPYFSLAFLCFVLIFVLFGFGFGRAPMDSLNNTKIFIKLKKRAFRIDSVISPQPQRSECVRFNLMGTKLRRRIAAAKNKNTERIVNC